MVDVFSPLTPGFIVVYGRRGVGKTTLLLQLLKEHDSSGRALLTRRDSVIAEKLGVSEKVDVIQRSLDLTLWLKTAANLLLWSRRASSPLLIVALPLELLLVPLDETSMRHFGRLIVVLTMIAESACVFLEVTENPKFMLPYRYFLLAELSERFYHMARGRRVRVISRVRIPLPEVGETWSHDEIAKSLTFERRAILAPLPDAWGFRVMRIVQTH